MSIGLIVMLIAIIVFVILPSLKSRTMKIHKLIVLPMIFLYLLYNGILENFKELTLSGYLYLLTGAIVGMLIGIFIRKKTLITVDKINREIQLPGTYLNLIIFCIIFAVHYVIGYFQAVQPEILTRPSLEQGLLLFALSASSLLMLGSSACLFYRYFRAEPCGAV